MTEFLASKKERHEYTNQDDKYSFEIKYGGSNYEFWLECGTQLQMRRCTAQGEMMYIQDIGTLLVPSKLPLKLKLSFFVLTDILYLKFPDFAHDCTFAISLEKKWIYVESISDGFYEVMRHMSEKDGIEDVVRQMEIGHLEREVADIKRKCKKNQGRNQLADIRETKTDFNILCKDEVVIPVHESVLTKFWPFFETMMENSCKEKEERMLRLGFGSDVVELLVADFYGQEVVFSLDQAFSLLEVSGMYDLPKMSATAYESFLDSEPDLSLNECVKGWRSARIANHCMAKEFFFRLIVDKTKPALKSEGRMPEFEGMTQQETLDLFFEVLKV